MGATTGGGGPRVPCHPLNCDRLLSAICHVHKHVLDEFIIEFLYQRFIERVEYRNIIFRQFRTKSYENRKIM